LKEGTTSSYDYSKYEAKYDLLGNFNETNYNYIVKGETAESLGVIYYMKDQFGNEASFDFENIVYTGGIIHGVNLETFAGIKNGDLRSSKLINNVRIKHSPFDLPGFIFTSSSGYGKISINNVDIDNSYGIFIDDTNLHNVKISNSSGINIDMGFSSSSQTYYSTFENLNICDNQSLNITCEPDFNGLFESVGGLYINNLNILPSFTSKTIDVSDLHSQTAHIVIQGLNDSNITRKIDFNGGQNGWTPALLDGLTEAVNLLFAHNPGMLTGVYDSLIYDSIFNASKNIKPFDIFNPVNDDGNILYTLEIPQFQSTATSVVELGI
jgi:hypothetical protein